MFTSTTYGIYKGTEEKQEHGDKEGSVKILYRGC